MTGTEVLGMKGMPGNEGHIIEDPSTEAVGCGILGIISDTQPRNQAYTRDKKPGEGDSHVDLSLGHFSPLPLFPLPFHSVFLSSPSHPLNSLLHTHTHTLFPQLTACGLRKVETSNSEVYQPSNNVQEDVL